MKRVLCGTLFQNTMESAPKFCPLTVITNGVLLTGTVLGSSIVSAGGETCVPNDTFGLTPGVPQARLKTREKTTASSKQVERMLASLKWRAFYSCLSLCVVTPVPEIPRPARILTESLSEFLVQKPALDCNSVHIT